MIQPEFKDIVIATMYVQVAGVERAPAYKKWLAFPEGMTTYKMTSIADVAADYNLPTHYL